MELQSASPVFVEGLRVATVTDSPVVVGKEFRSEPARAAVTRLAIAPEAEETMVPDQRAGLTPAQSVEQKLTAMLRSGAAIPVSHFRLAKLCRKG